MYYFVGANNYFEIDNNFRIFISSFIVIVSLERHHINKFKNQEENKQRVIVDTQAQDFYFPKLNLFFYKYILILNVNWNDVYEYTWKKKLNIHIMC